MADRSGYLGRSPSDSPIVIARQKYDVTSTTSTFTFDATYLVGYLDVYLNGVRLVDGSDFSASDKTTFNLVTAADPGDFIEAVAYKAFNLAIVSLESDISGYASTAGISSYSTYAAASGISSYSDVSGISTVSEGLTGTPNIIVGFITATSASFSGNISVAGTITYDDVTNVDSVGLITARSGLHVGDVSVGATVTPAGDASFVGVITCFDLNTTSDINLKQNVETVGNALSVINELRGVKFEWKKDGKPSYGVIAQELEKVLPELVTDTDPKTVNYTGIIGVLIEAIKELSGEIKELKKDK